MNNDERFEMQTTMAKAITDDLLAQGTAPVAGAQVLALATARMANHADVADADYLAFVRELAQAIITGTGCASGNQKSASH